MRHAPGDLARNVLRAAGDLVDVVKADGDQGVEQAADVLQALELAVERGRGQRNLDLVVENLGKGIRHGDLGVVGPALCMMRTDADALAAVDAALLDDVRAAAVDADRLGGAVLQARRAALALLPLEHDGMVIGRLFHEFSPSFSLRIAGELAFLFFLFL